MFNTAELTPGTNKQSIAEVKFDLGGRLLRTQQQIWATHVADYTLLSGIKNPDHRAAGKHLNHWLAPCNYLNLYSGMSVMKDTINSICDFLRAYYTGLICYWRVIAHAMPHS